MPAPSDAELLALAGTVAERLAPAGLRLVTAESCTAGWIAKACTDLPGSSRWFRGGVVAYDDAIKSDVLGVPGATLAREGAVSESVVRAMALGVLDRLGGEIAVAVSGIAGPDGGTRDKPVGTVWFAWARRTAGATEVLAVHREVFPGSREAVRRAAVACALRGLLGP
jgi:nicotinamide-nucleotide amidase